MLPTTINGQWLLLLPEHRAARPEWATKDGFEKKRLDHMRATTKIGDIIYYVGAEEGDMAALLSLWGANLIMFEPNLPVWANIKAVWDANNLKPPIACFAGFAANKTDPIPVDLVAGFPQSADGPVIIEHGFKNLCEADGSVPMVKIDDMVTDSFPVPDMISIDVEGAEWEVLRGAEQVLREHHPKIYLSLHPEFLFQIYGEYATDLRNWIKALGYKEKLLDYQHEVHLYYVKEGAV